MTSMDAAPEPARLGKWKRRLMVALSSLAVVATCVAIRAIGGREHAKAENPPIQGNRSGPGVAQASSNQLTPQAPNATSSQQPVVALINGEEIHRSELAQECLAQFGKDVLETLMNKFLISTFCEQHNIQVTKQDVDGEITRLAQKFGIPKDQWLKMLQDERGIKPEQYANDIIWPTLALRKVAEKQTQPTEQEIVDAYETQYGVAVRARLIVLDKPELAREVEAKIRANPTLDNFGTLARKYSCDPPSASIEGRIMPIHRHMGDPSLEAVAFQMKDGEISQLVKVHDQWVMLYCEGHTEPSSTKLEEVRGRLTEFVRETKLRNVAADVFKDLQSKSQVVNVYNDPAKRAQMPGVAATINGKTITIRDLSEACVDRHGTEMLEMMIQRKLVEQELKHRNMTITQQDLDAEIGRAAVSAGKLKKDKTPDVDSWMKMVLDQGITKDKYIREAVWPSAAMKKIAGDVEVTEQDIQFGYQANYGTKAEVRAIVLDSQRRAQEVWEKASKNPRVDFFGQLAEQYSMEPASRSNEGRVPPIRQHGGQPELEKEAFSLKQGEISGIIQVSDKFVILYLENFTKPTQGLSMQDARPYIYEDIHEKKLRAKMSGEFDRLKEDAQIDNFLAGTSQTPKKRISQNGPPGSKNGNTALPDAAVPAAYETTGLMPKSMPSTSQPRTAMPSAGDVQQQRSANVPGMQR